LSHDTALAMTQRGPRAQLHEFAGVGHAPTLVQPEQVDVLRRFLFSP
jgi:pimeloyl-ACP methyl ester carboxylesterase